MTTLDAGARQGTRPAATAAETMTAAASTPGRIAFIDNARAIGIVLVVVGHAPGFPVRLIDFVFAFHMPLFFLLSGLLVDRRRLDLTIRVRVAALARSLLVPYAFYFVVSWLYWLVAKRHGLRATEMEALPWWDPLTGFVRGNGDGLYVDVVLWFFPCLFVVATLHHALRKALTGVWTTCALAVAAALFIALHDSAQPRWWWSADCAMVAGAFYALGTILNRHVRHEVFSVKPVVRLALAAAAGAGCFVLSTFTGHIDLNSLTFGANPVLYLPAAVLGIVATMSLAATIPLSRLAVWLSSNTLVVFPLHFLVFSVITGFALVMLGFEASFKESVAAGITYTVVALIACWPAGRLIRRVFPWVLTSRHRASTSAADRSAVGLRRGAARPRSRP